jgi:hypothetical protein
MMAKEKDAYYRWPTPEGAGLDAAYEKTARNTLQFETDQPKDMNRAYDDKDPHHEFAQPGSSEGVRVKTPTAPVKNDQNNPRPDGSTDPQGQQAGTFGGQRAVPREAGIAPPSHPRIDADARKEQSGYPRVVE